MLFRNSTQNLLVVMGALYSACMFVGINNSSSVQPIVSIERTVFYRERAAGMYSSIAYAAAQVRKSHYTQNLANYTSSQVVIADTNLDCNLTGSCGNSIHCSADNSIWPHHLFHD